MQSTVKNQPEFPLSEQIKREYHILSLLGVGGMGDVYLAEQLRVGRRQVALKVLNPMFSADPEMVQRFENEAASEGRIHHHNVVTVYESRVTADGQLYVAMEYVEGKTLTALLAEQGTLPLAKVVAIIKQVCAGLAAAHRLGIVHRDIKPDNIMLTDEDNYEVVKILDFGLARISEAISATKRTQAGIIMGTPEYMSPEQAAGKTGDHIDARSDIYAVAALAYEMLVGRPAFKESNPFETIKKQITERPMPLRHWKPDLQISDEVEQVLMIALEKDRAKRFQTIGEFAREFETAAAIKPPRSAPPATLFGGASNQPVVSAREVNKPAPPLADANKTSLLGGTTPPALPTRQESRQAEDVNKTTLLGGNARPGLPPKEDANKTTLIGANRKSATPPHEDANKTTLLGGNMKPISPPRQEPIKPPAPSTGGKPASPPKEDANKTTVFGASGKPTAPHRQEVNKPAVPGAGGKPALPPREEVNKTTVLGAGKKPEMPRADEANKTTMFGAQSNQPKAKPAVGDTANQTAFLGANSKVPPAAHNTADETITIGGSSGRQQPPPEPSAYETNLDISAQLSSAMETQVYSPNVDPPSAFTDTRQPNIPAVQPKPAAVEASQPFFEMPAQVPPAYHQSTRQPAVGMGATSQPASNRKILWIVAIVLGLLIVAAIAWFALSNSGKSNAKAPAKAAVAGTSLVEYRIKRENATADLETLPADNRVKAAEGFGFEVRALAPGSIYLFDEQSDGSWRWLNAQRSGEAPTLQGSQWSQIPFGYWLNLNSNVREEKYMLVYVPRSVAWSPATAGANNLTVKNGAADLSAAVAANIKGYLQREAAPLNTASEMRDKNVRFSLSKEGAANRVTYTAFSLKAE